MTSSERLKQLQAALARVEMPKIGDVVETAVELPGIPAGSTGTVRATDRLFVAVEFADGRIGYYSSRQLHRAGARSRSDQKAKQ